MNNLYYFEIQAADPERAMRFYETVLGWAFTKQEGLPTDYWTIEAAGIPGGLLRRPANTPPPEHGTNAYVCSMQVDNFDAIATTILQNGGRVALDKFAIPGKCWQGYFTDPEGNSFGVFQPDPTA
ncbi:MAG: VOC family protein [Candidatus Dormibacteria bacterium]